MLEEKQRVNGPKLKIIITIIIFTHSSDINSMQIITNLWLFLSSVKKEGEKRDRNWETERREGARERLKREIEIVHVI